MSRVVAAAGWLAERSASALAQGGDLPPPRTGEEEARRQAEEILADFRWGEPEGDDGWLRGLARGIGEVIDAVVGALFGSGIVTLVVWILIAAAVAWLAWAVARGWRRRPRAERPTVEERSLEASRAPHEWRSEAEELEARGEWKLGLRARYRALVSELIGRGHLRDIPGRTTGEFRIELADGLPRATVAFDEATGLFERAWYGDRPTGPDEAHRFERLADSVLERVPEGAPA